MVYTQKFPQKLVAIVECKKEGSLGKSKTGIDQLQSYLCASDTSLGIFANSLNPADWIYMENLGNNIFVKITQDQFIISVKTEIETHKDLQQRISDKLEKLILQKATENLKNTAIQQRIQQLTNDYIEQEARKNVTPGKIVSATINMSAERIKQLEAEISKLKRYKTWGWILAVLFLFFLLAMFYN